MKSTPTGFLIEPEITMFAREDEGDDEKAKARAAFLPYPVERRQWKIKFKVDPPIFIEPGDKVSFFYDGGSVVCEWAGADGEVKRLMMVRGI